MSRPNNTSKMKHVTLTRQDERVLAFVRDDLRAKYADLFTQGAYLFPAMIGNTEVFALETPGVLGHMRLPLTMDESTGLSVQEATDWLNWHILQLTPTEVKSLHERLTVECEAFSLMTEGAEV